jgi:hypothetical protein
MNDENRDHDAGPDELTDAAREALRGLPREMIPPAGLEERVTLTLQDQGLLRPSAGHPLSRAEQPTRGRLTRISPLAAAAAALALFASGVVVGRWNATRGFAGMADTEIHGRSGDPAAQAAEVQQAGSDYVRAVAGLADLAAKGDEKAVAPGREAATVALHAAALELARLSPDDSTLRLVLAVLEDRLRTTGKLDHGGAQHTFWF